MRKIIETNEMFRKVIEDKEELEGYLISGITITSKDFGEEVPCEYWCTDYRNVTFHNVTFEGIEFDSFAFSSCMFTNSVFNNSIMKFTKFRNCAIEGTIFKNMEFRFSEFKHSILFGIEYKKCNFEIDNRFTNCRCLPMDQFIFNKCTFQYEPLLMRSSKIPLINLVSNIQDLKKILFDICESTLPKYPIVNIGPIGSRNRFTTYIPYIDWVYCGCWTDEKDNPDLRIYRGGHLDAFEKQVQNTYPEGKYHDQYMAAIQLFKVYRDQFYKKEKENHK